MDTRYQIEEMVSQDEGGVVFQGTDTVTGVIVAMRRFIASGGRNTKLGDADRQGYEGAVTYLKKVTHPSLRRVLGGGCDPVDNMPYLATRWIDGALLGELMGEDQALDFELVHLILDQFLDANSAITEIQGRDGLWLDTTPGSIIMKSPRDESDPPIALFWPCPWQWLLGDKAGSETMALADLAEAMLGGPRKIAANDPDGHLSQWIKAIRAKSITNLKDARSSLQPTKHPEKPPAKETSRIQKSDTKEASVSEGDSLGVFDSPGLKVPTTPLPVVTPRAVLPGEPQKKHGLKPAQLVIAATLLGAIALFSWLLVTRDPPEPTQQAEFVAGTGANQARINDMLAQAPSNNSALEERRQHIERRGYYTVDEADLLLELADQEVTLRGRLVRIRISSSGLTMYLEFSEEAPNEQPRVYAMTRNLTDGIRPEDLQSFVGKPLEIRGPVDIETVGGIQRPRVELLDRIRISVLDTADDYELR